MPYEVVADRIPGPRITRALIFSALLIALLIFSALFFALEGAELLITTPRVILLALPFVLFGVTLGLVRKSSAPAV